jgi:hypothetical protein
MAKQVFKIVELSLQDEKAVTIRPLPIARLKRFFEAWSKFQEIEDDDDAFGIYINCCGISLEDNFKGQFDSLRANKEDAEKGEFLSEEYKEYLEGVLDLPTIYEILDVCGDIKLNDPNLLAKAQEAAEASQA